MHVIYGGTFDPIHHGHLRVAIELQERLGVERIHLVPCHIPPHRESPGGTSDDRLALLSLALRGEPSLSVDDRELRRGGSSYTADTLRQLRAELGPDCPLAMVVGTDSFAGFHRWREWQRIPDLAHIVLVRRPGASVAADSPPAELLSQRRVESPEHLRARPAGCILELDPPLLDISATGIRRRLGQGKSIRYLVPDRVLDEIEGRRLYR